MRLIISFQLVLVAMRSIGRFINRHSLLIASLLLCCVVIGFVTRAYTSSAAQKRITARSDLVGPTSRDATPSPAQALTRESVRLLKFNLFDAGICPREVHVDKGLVAIIIEDYTGGTAGLVIERRETGKAPERAGHVERAGPHWRGKSEMRLTPGSYWVYMDERPGNQALLVVEP